MAERKKRARSGENGVACTLRGMIMHALSFPEGALSGVPYMELQGDASLTITGYETLLSYEENCLLFRMKDPDRCGFTLLRISGRDLRLYVVKNGCLRVRGRIDMIVLHPPAQPQ